MSISLTLSLSNFIKRVLGCRPFTDSILSLGRSEDLLGKGGFENRWNRWMDGWIFLFCLGTLGLTPGLLEYHSTLLGTSRVVQDTVLIVPYRGPLGTDESATLTLSGVENAVSERPRFSSSLLFLRLLTPSSDGRPCGRLWSTAGSDRLATRGEPD